MPRVSTLSPDEAFAKRVFLSRYVLDPCVLVIMLCAIASFAVIASGNILGADGLAARGFLAGAVVGAAGAYLFARNRLDWLPGLVLPLQRLFRFCAALSVTCGFVFMTLALLTDRFVLPGPEEIWQMRLVDAGRAARGGAWVVHFARETGEVYRQEFQTGFCPVVIGQSYRFDIRNGILGYPFFLGYECPR